MKFVISTLTPPAKFRPKGHREVSRRMKLLITSSSTMLRARARRDGPELPYQAITHTPSGPTRHRVMTPAVFPCPIAHSEAGSDQAEKRMAFYPTTIQLPPSREA